MNMSSKPNIIPNNNNYLTMNNSNINNSNNQQYYNPFSNNYINTINQNGINGNFDMKFQTYDPRLNAQNPSQIPSYMYYQPQNINFNKQYSQYNEQTNYIPTAPNFSNYDISNTPNFNNVPIVPNSVSNKVNNDNDLISKLKQKYFTNVESNNMYSNSHANKNLNISKPIPIEQKKITPVTNVNIEIIKKPEEKNDKIEMIKEKYKLTLLERQKNQSSDNFVDIIQDNKYKENIENKTSTLSKEINYDKNNKEKDKNIIKSLSELELDKKKNKYFSSDNITTKILNINETNEKNNNQIIFNKPSNTEIKESSEFSTIEAYRLKLQGKQEKESSLPNTPIISTQTKLNKKDQEKELPVHDNDNNISLDNKILNLKQKKIQNLESIDIVNQLNNTISYKTEKDKNSIPINVPINKIKNKENKLNSLIMKSPEKQKEKKVNHE